MAMHIPTAPGFLSMMKEGSRHFQGIEESVVRNIQACAALGETTASTYGTYGMKKMVINHIGQKFVTKDAGTILRELEIEHPAAKLVVMAAEQQQQECGECTNFVVLLASALLEKSEWLIKMGLPLVDIIRGYEMASKYTTEILNELQVETVADLRDSDKVGKVINTAMQTKLGDGGYISGLVTEACIRGLTDGGYFNVDGIRVVKILGSGLSSSRLYNGMVFIREAQGTVNEVNDTKVAVFTCPFDQLQTETKGTILINTAEELKSFSTGEEDLMESRVREIYEAGVRLIVTGGKVGDLALHFGNKYGIMIVRLTSKFDVRRVCKVTGATPLPKLTVPTKEELGSIKSARTEEIGRTTVVILDQDTREGAISTIVVRGGMHDVMNEVERAIDDGVNTYKCLTRDNRLLAGAGATEIELANRLNDYANCQSGLIQYSVRQFGLSFEKLVKILCDNAGENATDKIAELKAAHREGNTKIGLVSTESGQKVTDATEENVFDTFNSRYYGIKFATEAVTTVLRVNDIHMAKSAGGPKVRQPGSQDPDDD